MKIEIKNPIVQVKTINGKNGAFELFQLEAWAHIDPNGYPEKVIFQVEQNEKFEVGTYTLDTSSFYVGSFNKLEVGKAKLVKIQPAPAKPASAPPKA